MPYIVKNPSINQKSEYFNVGIQSMNNSCITLRAIKLVIFIFFICESTFTSYKMAASLKIKCYFKHVLLRYIYIVLDVFFLCLTYVSHLKATNSVVTIVS